MTIRTLTALGLVAALATPAFANGVISEFPAGGVVFKEAADIAIAREDLYLSIREVRVHYDYQSDAKQTQTHTIGFPMPMVPLDFSPDHLGGVMLDEVDNDSVNYMKFKASVNGKPLAVTPHTYAWVNGVNVTSELEALGIPLYIDSNEGLPPVFGTIDPKVKADLAARGIISLDSYGEPEVALWQYQTVYEWQQDFAPGLTQVDISYAPMPGFPSDIGDTYEGGGEYSDPDSVKEVSDAYCIDDSLVRAIKKREANHESYEIIKLGYVVTTGNMWKGPIGEFNLTVDKADTRDDDAFGLVAFCPLDSTKISETAFKWSAKDFVAEREIEVLYYSFYQPYTEEELAELGADKPELSIGDILKQRDE